MLRVPGEGSEGLSAGALNPTATPTTSRAAVGLRSRPMASSYVSSLSLRSSLDPAGAPSVCACP